MLGFDELGAAGDVIGEELRPEGPPPRRPLEELFQSPSDDDTQTSLDQIA